MKTGMGIVVVMTMAFACALSGCATSGSRLYVPGTETSVGMTRQTMTRSVAMDEIRKMVSTYVTELTFTNQSLSGSGELVRTLSNPTKPQTGGSRTDGIWCKTEMLRLDDKGFLYVEKGSLLVGNPFSAVGTKAINFTLKYVPEYVGKTFVLTNNVQYAEITSAHVRDGGGAPIRATFYAGDKMVLAVELNESQSAYNRALAAAEIVFTNMTGRATK